MEPGDLATMLIGAAVVVATYLALPRALERYLTWHSDLPRARPGMSFTRAAFAAHRFVPRATYTLLGWPWMRAGPAIYRCDSVDRRISVLLNYDGTPWCNQYGVFCSGDQWAHVFCDIGRTDEVVVETDETLRVHYRDCLCDRYGGRRG